MYSNFNNNTSSIPEKKKKKLVRCGGIILNESLTHLVGVMNYESLQDDVISNWSPYKSSACRVLWQWVDKGMPND